MTNDTLYTIQYEEFDKGIVDMKGLADLTTGTEVYIQTDDTVSAIFAGATSAVTDKRLGWVVRPFDFSEDERVGIQSKYNRRCTRTATTSITAGQDLVIDYTDPTEVTPYVQATHEEREIIGRALTSAWENYDVEVAEE